LCPSPNRQLHSFPTRRSSDLIERRNSADDVDTAHQTRPPNSGQYRAAGPEQLTIKDLHRQIELLVAAGFTPVQAIRIATLNGAIDRKSTRLNSSHSQISYAVF